MSGLTSSSATMNDYFDRKAEALVLEGFRLLTHGVEASRAEPGRHTRSFYRDLLGETDSATAIKALERFVSTLASCASAPLNAFQPGSRFISRDEVFILGIVASIQNWDEQTLRHCLEQCCVQNRMIEVAAAAEAFALTLTGLGMVMKPLPTRLRGRITTIAAKEAGRKPAPATMH
jgi:hypothetical protein